MPATREKLSLVAHARIGVPYIWFAKGMERGKVSQRVVLREPLSFLAFDCSGFVTSCLALCDGPDYRWSHHTDRMWNEWPAVAEADLKLMDLVFYGKENDPNHVMFWLGKEFAIGASGGGKNTTEPTPGARVRVTGVHYRKDLIGYRSMLPFVVED